MLGAVAIRTTAARLNSAVKLRRFPFATHVLLQENCVLFPCLSLGVHSTYLRLSAGICGSHRLLLYPLTRCGIFSYTAFMPASAPTQAEIARAPEGVREALLRLVEIAMMVAEMLGGVAQAEKSQNDAAAQGRAIEKVPDQPASYAEAIEMDRGTMAAFEPREPVASRSERVGKTFDKVARGIRLTVAMLERIDRGWARPTVSDDRRAMKRRQVKRGVEDAIAREAEGERAERLTESLRDRLDSLDFEDDMADRPVDEVIGEICRLLGLAASGLKQRPAKREKTKPAEAGQAPETDATGPWAADPWQQPARRKPAKPAEAGEAPPVSDDMTAWPADPWLRRPDG